MPTKYTLVPYMCDHVYALAAALEHFDTPAEVIVPADEESATLGIDLVLGKECTPCTYVVGDVVRRLRRGDLDPAQTRIYLSDAAGPCRYGQYHVLVRHILDEQGFRDVEMIFPSAGDSYQGMGGDHPAAFRALCWQAIVAVDLLQMILHRTRPYAAAPEEVEQAYRRGLDAIVAGVRAGGPLVDAMRLVGREFRALPVDRSSPRPQIGLVGEIYVRHHWPSNRNVIRRVEALGGEVVLATLMEYLYYVNWWCVSKARRERDWRTLAEVQLIDLYQRWIEFRLVMPVADLLVHRFETRSARLMRHTARYMDPEIGTEAVMSVGKAVELAGEGACGILNVLPFTCMPGTITAGLAPRVRRDLDGIPWLDLSYDMQQGTNIQTRLEAFMYQARHFQQQHPPAARHARVGGVVRPAG